MMGIHEHATFWAAVVLQIVGVASVVGARLGERFGFRLFSQRLCYVCLLLIGSATMLAVVCGSDLWFAFATTLALMSVGATIDFGRSRRVSTV